MTAPDPLKAIAGAESQLRDLIIRYHRNGHLSEDAARMFDDHAVNLAQVAKAALEPAHGTPVMRTGRTPRGVEYEAEFGGEPSASRHDLTGTGDLRYGDAVCDWEDRCPCDCGECTVHCDKPGRFLVERSDHDPSYDVAMDRAPAEACEAHLADTVMGLMDGNDKIHAIVRPRWN